MARSAPPLAWFTAFECAARRLSFTAAAAELNLTQSAISQHVRALERRLGCALFVRKHRSIALTDEGRRLLPTVSTAVASLRDVTRMFDVADTKRVLTVSASISVAQAYIVPNASAFMEAHPDWGLNLTTRVWPDEFLGSNADVEIRFCPLGPLAMSDNGERPLGRDELIVVASPAMRPEREEPSPATVAGLPLIQVSGTSDNWQAWAHRVGYDGALGIVCTVESHGLAVDCAEAGIGLAYTSSLIAAPALAAGRLARVGTVEHPAKDGYSIRIGNNGSRAISEAFDVWLQGEIERKITRIKQENRHDDLR